MWTDGDGERGLAVACSGDKHPEVSIRRSLLVLGAFEGLAVGVRGVGEYGRDAEAIDRVEGGGGACAYSHGFRSDAGEGASGVG